jgi:alpha-galactosidase
MRRPRSVRELFLVSVAVLLWAARPLADAPSIVAAYEDAYIAHDPSSQAWSIGNSNIELVVGFDASNTLVVQELHNPATQSALDIDQSADASVTIGGNLLLLNQSNATTTFIGATAEATDAGVLLIFTFEHNTLHTIIRREYACYPGSPTFEVWTRLEAPPGALPMQISNLVGWQLTMPDVPVRWVDGLRGDSAGDATPDPAAFTFDGGELDDGVETDIGSVGRSSETFLPFVFLDNGSEQFYGGVIWSGAWRIGMLRSGDRVAVSALFPGTVTALAPGQPVEFPHTFFGYTEDSTSSSSAALRQFVLRGIRRGRPIQPLVTYNTWYAYGADINEAEVDAEMIQASALGVELFVLDAGWWTGAGEQGQGDFSSGLGSYVVDPVRFPSQLVGMAAQAHALGMKFGLWVEPERVAFSNTGGPDLAQEQWLATVDGSYDGDGLTAQLCLGSPAARKWVLHELVTLIDTIQPDYLKWDNNFWINCNRSGHGHGTGDGNFAHVMGLYEVLDALRQRYPDLLIENSSGGGNRLDYGMLAYTDAGWMDDLTVPSDHVRHNIEGLSLALPPAYLLSFVIDSQEEPLEGGDLPQIVRSRMPGVLGATYRYTDLDQDLISGLATGIAQYKLLRGTIAQAAATLLSSQAPVAPGGWDVIQEVADDQQNAIIFAFKSDADDGSLTVQPQNLLPDTTYDVSSVDNGPMGSATGSDLMRDGVELVQTTDESSAHLIVFTAE